jgi:hypothetical protein
MALGERLGTLQRLRQASRDPRLALALDERLQIPGGLLELWV